MKIRVLTTILYALVSAVTNMPAHSAERYCGDDGVRTLHVEMYPFVPNAEGMALKIRDLFEEGCPGLTLQLTMNPNYYSADNTGILSSDADVYEVDSVFFDDFIKHRSPKPPSQAVIDAAGRAVPFAKSIASIDGVEYGIPHWICSDFLIYPKTLTQIGSVKTTSDAVQVFKNLGKGPLIDVKGKSTLGELYLSILVAHYGSATEALKRLDPARIDDYAVNILREFVAMEPAGFGRDADYHNREGFYPRQFARGSGSAYVGYSEDSYYSLAETAGSCLQGQCLTPDDLDVASWPFADEGARPVAWVDMYMLDTRLGDAKLRDAEAFLKFMMSTSTYEALLVPEGGPPRYLLPARDDMYTDSTVKAAAPLYTKFRGLIDQATPVTGDGLNAKLHAVAVIIDGLLPSAH
jgi:thiamine pyridinylase